MGNDGSARGHAWEERRAGDAWRLLTRQSGDWRSRGRRLRLRQSADEIFGLVGAAASLVLRDLRIWA